MANEGKLIDLDNIVRDEYEIELYGFSLKDFARENFVFVESKIHKAVDDLDDQFTSLVQETNPELAERVRALKASVTEQVVQSCQKDVEKTNEKIIEKLRIPDNVLLIEDSDHLKNYTIADELQLKDDCAKLAQTVKENAHFILLLKRELQSLQELATADDDLIFTKIEEHLNSVLISELSQETANKLKDLPRDEI